MRAFVLTLAACATHVGAFVAIPAFPGSVSRATQIHGSDAAIVGGAPSFRRGSLKSRGLQMGRRSEKIARTKGKEDLRRGKIFARCAKRIMMAVKAGGPDEHTNKALFDVLKEAKSYNVPKDNITRAIKRAVEGSQGDFKEAVYEAYGHGGVGLIITALTDNVNRANAEINAVLSKKDLKRASSGSVAFQFARRGRVEVKGGEVDEEAVIEAAITAGVDDVEVVEGDEPGTTWILTAPTELSLLADALAAASPPIEGEIGLANVPSAFVECGDADAELNLRAVEALEELDDVDFVDTNMA